MMQFDFVILKILGLKDSASNLIIILYSVKRQVVWNGPIRMCCNYSIKQYSEKLFASL